MKAKTCLFCVTYYSQLFINYSQEEGEREGGRKEGMYRIYLHKLLLSAPLLLTTKSPVPHCQVPGAPNTPEQK